MGLIAIVGAYHIVLFGLHPGLPPEVKTEVMWGELDNTPNASIENPKIDTALCRTEAVSSEADSTNTPADTEANRVRFEYRPEAEAFINTGTSANIVMAEGSSITIGKKSYPLQLIEFKKNDKSSNIAIHLIHQIKDNKVAVITVPVKVSSTNNPAIDALWRYLPKHKGDHNSLDDIHLDIDHLLPKDRTFYRYPKEVNCNDNIVLLGLSSPVTISTKQLALLSKALKVQNKTASL